jgi:hypothetical protein
LKMPLSLVFSSDNAFGAGREEKVSNDSINIRRHSGRGTLSEDVPIVPKC